MSWAEAKPLLEAASAGDVKALKSGKQGADFVDKLLEGGSAATTALAKVMARKYIEPQLPQVGIDFTEVKPILDAHTSASPLLKLTSLGPDELLKELASSSLAPAEGADGPPLALKLSAAMLKIRCAHHTAASAAPHACNNTCIACLRVTPSLQRLQSLRGRQAHAFADSHLRR